MTHPANLPFIPPGEDELPHTDGEPMESERHRKQMNLLIESLDYALRDRDDVHVGGNMFIYFSELQTKHNDFRGPDVFVVLDTVRRERKSWVVWKEDGRTPNVVVELVSESTEHVDRVDKMRIYARNLHVGEYYIYDPMTHRLDGYRLNSERGQYDPIAPADDGAVWCAQLGLWLGTRPGLVGGIDTEWLRWIDAHGQVLPLPAEAEAQRAEGLQQQLAAYEAAYGKLPGR